MHELNVDPVIEAFLPYHDSPQFPRILSIIRLDPKLKSPYYSLLNPMQKSPTTLDRGLLCRYMSPAKDKSLFLLQRIMGMLSKAVEEGAGFRTLFSFWSATMVEFLEKIRGEGGVPEAVVKALVDGFVRALVIERGGRDYATTIYPALLVFLRSIPLTAAPYTIIIHTLGNNRDVELQHRVLTLMICLEYSPDAWQVDLGERWEKIFSIAKNQDKIGETITIGLERYGLERSSRLISIWLLQRAKGTSPVVRSLINSPSTPMVVLKTIAKHSTRVREGETQEDTAARQYLGSLLNQRHPELVATAIKAAGENVLLPKGLAATRSRADDMEVDAVDGSLEDEDMEDDDVSPFIQAMSADLSRRVQGIEKLLQTYETFSPEDRQSAQSILMSQLTENESELIDTIYDHPEAVLSLLNPSELIDTLAVPMYKGETKRDVVVSSMRFLCSGHR